MDINAAVVGAQNGYRAEELKPAQQVSQCQDYFQIKLQKRFFYPF